MNKKIFLALLLFIIGTITVNADVNYTSVSLVSNNVKNGQPFYFKGSNVKLTATYSNSDNTTNVTSMFCVIDLVDEVTQDYSTCQISGAGAELTSGCQVYVINDTSSPAVTNGITTLESGLNRYYCQVCNVTGSCDNSTFTGTSSGSFWITNIGGMGATFMLIFLWSIIAVFSIVILTKLPKKKLQTQKYILGMLVIGTILLVVAFQIIQSIIYGF